MTSGRSPFTLSWCEGWKTLSSSKTATTRRDSREDSAKASSKKKREKKIVGDEDKQDNALKASPLSCVR